MVLKRPKRKSGAESGGRKIQLKKTVLKNSAKAGVVSAAGAKEHDEVSRPLEQKKLPHADNHDSLRKTKRIDPRSVFVRGLPEGTHDLELKNFFEKRIGPTVQCFVIRDDYGIVKFVDESNVERCLQEVQGAIFQDAKITVESAKVRRPASKSKEVIPDPTEQVVEERRPASKSKEVIPDAAEEVEEEKKPEASLHLGKVIIHGLPKRTTHDDLQVWVDKKLPGGCGLKWITKSDITSESGGEISGASFVLHFRKESNAFRAVQKLQGAEFKTHVVSARLHAIEKHYQSSNAGRLILRNIAFNVTSKDIEKEFSKLGPLTEVHLPLKSAESSINRGFAFVKYEDAIVAERAIKEMNGTKICGRGVAVDWALDSGLYTKLQVQDQELHGGDKQQGEKQVHLETSFDGLNVSEEPEGKKIKTAEISHKDHEDQKEIKTEAQESEAISAEISHIKNLVDSSLGACYDDPKTAQNVAGKSDSVGDLPKRKSGFDVSEGCTLFIRNVPIDATEQNIHEVFSRFGKVKSVKLSRSAGMPKGTAFVQFWTADSAKAVLSIEADAEKKLSGIRVKTKGALHETPAVEGFGISVKGQRLVIKPALTPEDLKNAKEDISDSKQNERRKWIHLVEVGNIAEGSARWEALSPSEKKQRQQGMKERRYRATNSNFAINPLRLSIRNLPRHISGAQIYDKVIAHLMSHFKCDANASKKELREKAQKLVEKVELARSDTRRQASSENNERRSKGYGFIKFKEHKDAMSVLHYLNDNSRAFMTSQRPICEFVMEDKRKELYKSEIIEKYKTKLKERDEGKEPSTEITKKSKKHRIRVEGKMGRGARQRERKRLQKAAAEEKQIVDEKKRQSHNEKLRTKAATKRFLRTKPNKMYHSADATMPSDRKGKTRAPWDIADDYELRALKRFRA